MSLFNLTGEVTRPLDVWSTDNMAMFNQLGFWYDTDKVVQYVPTGCYGIVLITERGARYNTKPLMAWVVFRPLSIQLRHPALRDVQQVSMTLQDGIMWYNSFGNKWVHLKPSHGSTW